METKIVNKGVGNYKSCPYPKPFRYEPKHPNKCAEKSFKEVLDEIDEKFERERKLQEVIYNEVKRNPEN